MCTFVILHRLRDDFPLVVAATRDEFYARLTTSPAIAADAPGILAGRDVERGGSWLGVTRGGLFVGLTNQRSGGRLALARRTRGEVVMQALAAGTFDGVRRLVEGLDTREYNGFNLLFGDGERLAIAYAHPAASPVAEVQLVAPGLHILPNDRLDAPDWPKVGRARELVEPHLDARWPELATVLMSTLGDHRRPPLAEVPPPAEGSPLTRELLRELAALCIHTETYGTRSATITALGGGSVGHFLVADGAPCVTGFSERSQLLRAP